MEFVNDRTPTIASDSAELAPPSAPVPSDEPTRPRLRTAADIFGPRPDNCSSGMNQPSTPVASVSPPPNDEAPLWEPESIRGPQVTRPVGAPPGTASTTAPEAPSTENLLETAAESGTPAIPEFNWDSVPKPSRRLPPSIARLFEVPAESDSQEPSDGAGPLDAPLPDAAPLSPPDDSSQPGGTDSSDVESDAAKYAVERLRDFPTTTWLGVFGGGGTHDIRALNDMVRGQCENPDDCLEYKLVEQIEFVRFALVHCFERAAGAAGRARESGITHTCKLANELTKTVLVLERFRSSRADRQRRARTNGVTNNADGSVNNADGK